MRTVKKRRGRGAGRRAAVLVAVLVCVVAAAVILAEVLRTAAAGRHVIDGQAGRLQAAWLAEAGLERAAARLAGDPAYSGETWTIGPEELAAGGDPAVVRIAVEAVPRQPDRRRARAEADYPDDPIRRNRVGRQITIRLSTLRGT